MANRVLIGRGPDGDYALRVTKPGVDVLGSPGPDDYQFNSDWDRTGILHQTGVVSGLGTTVTFPALTFVPYVRLLRWDSASGTIFGPEQIGYTSGGAGSYGSSYYAKNITNSQFTVVGDINGNNIDLGGPVSDTRSPRVFQYFVYRIPCPGI